MSVAARPLLDLDAMAVIVRELVAGGEARRQDERWLRARIEEVGLDQHAASALESVRRKLCRGGTLLADDGVASWG
jgi:hypothetical protein